MSEQAPSDSRIEVRATDELVWLRCRLCDAEVTLAAEPMLELLDLIEEFISGHAPCRADRGG